MKNIILTAAVAAATLTSARAAIVISEVDPTGSSTGTYTADWFELTNTGTTPVSIAGWTMDDNSNSFSLSVPLNGVSGIAAGQSVVFIEDTTASSDTTLAASFKSTWFGSNVPAGFTIGFYGGSGVGLSSTTDAVNIFTSTGTLVSNVVFGASTPNVTFDNAAGLSNTTITQKSVVGVNGAFTATDGEVGSPGVVPEPGTYALLGCGLVAGAYGFRRQAASRAARA